MHINYTLSMIFTVTKTAKNIIFLGSTIEGSVDQKYSQLWIHSYNVTVLDCREKQMQHHADGIYALNLSMKNNVPKVTISPCG